MKVVYTANATSTGGRDNGNGKTDDGKIDVKLSVPKEMGGDGGAGTNPEQLFAVGYSACFLGAIKGAARKSGHKISDDSTVTAHVSFADREDDEGYGIVVSLEVHLPGHDKATAEDIVARAHRICPYSHVGRSGFPVDTTVV